MLHVLARAVGRSGFLAAAAIAVTSCGSSSPSILGPSAAAPISSVGSYTLPGDAPPNAAAPAGTTRITITTATFIDPNGNRVSPNALKVGVKYQFQAWGFCPTGLAGGNFETKITVADATTGVGGSMGASSVVIPSGYFHVDGLVVTIKVSQQNLHVEITRDFVVIASLDVALSFS
jgi:hypothetical protein